VVVASATQPRQEALPGAFTRAFARAARGPGAAGHIPGGLTVDALVNVMNADPELPATQRAQWAMVAGSGAIPDFLPNMRRDATLADLDLAEQAWRAVNDYGIRIDYRTYDDPGLGPCRRQHSGVTARRGLWEIHYDPYDLTRVFVRTPEGWVTAPWTHLPMISAPFADFTWRHARRLTAQAGRDDTSEAEVARVLDALLTRAHDGPSADKATARVAARTRVAAAAHRPPAPEELADGQAAEDEKEEQMAEVIPLGIFDARAEADRWPS
jgi:hypothetical protein